MQPKPSQMMDVDKMVKVVVRSLKNDTLEIKPFVINILKAMSRIAPGMLMKFGHREFKNFKAQSKNPNQ
jgi:uncharacterized oxidoreductase